MTDALDMSEERRLQVQAYHEWARVSGGKEFPTLADMGRVDISSFKDSSFLLDLEEDILVPRFTFIGEGLLDDCDAGTEIQVLSDVPQSSLLSRLSDQYLQCVSNRLPVGFEASFTNRKDEAIKYRGILLPISTDGVTIDHVWGTVNGMQDSKPGNSETSSNDIQPSDETGGLSTIIDTLSEERKAFIERVGSKMETLLDIEGLSCAALVDRDNGSLMATAGKVTDLDLTQLAAGCANILSETRATQVSIGLQDEAIEDMLFSLSSRHHLIQPITDKSGHGLFVLLILDRSADNLAMARYKISKFEEYISE